MRAQAPAQRARRGRLLVVHGVSKMTTATASFRLMHIKSGWGLLCAVAWVGHLATVSCLKPELVVIDCAVHASSRQVRMQLTPGTGMLWQADAWKLQLFCSAERGRGPLTSLERALWD